MNAELLSRIRIVLVAPTHPGNIGASARAMKNMGLSALHLVRPRAFPGPEATARAANATDVLENACVHEDLDAALQGCALVLGTSARARRIPWPLEDVRSAAERVIKELPSYDHDVAILFGRESRGLMNDELQKCHVHLNVPCQAEYPSLNLAMAVQIVSHELWMAMQGEAGRFSDPAQEGQPATTEEFERFIEHMNEALIDIEYLDPDNPRQLMTRLKRMFIRTRPDQTEINLLRGMMTSMQRAAGTRMGRRDAQRVSQNHGPDGQKGDV